MAKKNSIDYYDEAMQAVNQPAGQRKNVFYFYGEEAFFIDSLQEAVVRLLPTDQRDFNLDILYGTETTPDRALGIAGSFPMMSEFRVVVIREFSRMRGISDDEGHINDFVPFIENPNPSTLLFLTDKKPADKRTQIGKLLTASKSVYSRNFEKVQENSLPEWIREWIASKYNKSIEPGAAQMLAQLVGSDLHVLSTEIEKVCTFADTSNSIGLDQVKEIIGSYREYSMFELKEAVLKRDLAGSLRISEQMLLRTNEDAGEVFRTVGFFYSVFSNMWQILRLSEKGLSKTRIQQEMGIGSNWYFNLLWSEASAYKLSDMPRIFEALLDADKAGKGFGTLDTSSILLLLIRRIVSN